MSLDTAQKRGSVIDLGQPWREWQSAPSGVVDLSSRLSLVKLTSDTNDPSDALTAPAARGSASAFGRVIEELILDEYDPRLSRAQITFKQTSGAAAAFVLGQTLRFYGGAYQPADDATCTAVLLKNLPNVASGVEVTVPALVGGPAVINTDALAFVEGADKAGQLAALAAMRGIRLVSQPTNTNIGRG